MWNATRWRYIEEYWGREVCTLWGESARRRGWNVQPKEKDACPTCPVYFSWKIQTRATPLQIFTILGIYIKPIADTPICFSSFIHAFVIPRYSDESKSGQKNKFLIIMSTSVECIKKAGYIFILFNHFLFQGCNSDMQSGRNCQYWKGLSYCQTTYVSYMEKNYCKTCSGKRVSFTVFVARVWNNQWNTVSIISNIM